MTERHKLSFTAGAYLLLSIALCGVRPLWLDEILQLIDTRHGSPEEIVKRLPANHPGSAPLGYLTQSAGLKMSGYSVRKARLLSTVFAAAAVFVTGLLALELGVRCAWLASLIFAAFPLTLRYATEGRPYAEALFFSVLATLFYLRLARRQTWRTAVAYAIVLAAAAYTHPYSASIGFAHVLWSIRMRNWRAALLGSLALAFVVGAFLPWYLWSREAWSEAIAAYRFQFSLKTPPMMFRELAGAGYWGSGLLGILCVVGMQTESRSRQERWFFLSMVFVPIVAILAANALFGYFIASRQFIWILPVVAILAASAVERRGRFAVCIGVLLGATCIAISARFFMGPHENWEAAAQAIAGYSERQNACVVVSPPGSLRLYRYFRPELGRRSCDPARVVLVITPYTPDKERASVIARLTAKGYRKLGETDAGNSLILRFTLAR